MARTAISRARIAIRQLSPERWGDLERLFGARGACGGCWCMYWRLTSAEYQRRKGSGNKRAFRRIVGAGDPPGLLAYAGDEPVGWIALAPREAYPRLDRSRILKPVDDEPVWSITCFFVEQSARRQGLSVALLRGAVEHAARCGARIVEGYPVEPAKVQPAAFVWTGLAAAFRRAGFVEVARRSATRPIMRYVIERDEARSRARQAEKPATRSNGALHGGPSA